MADPAPSLADEACHLHACLFHRPLDPVVIARYEAAHLVAPSSVVASSVIAKVVAMRLDAEAVEFALRRRGKGKELARKMQIVCYLVEVRPDYLDRFVNLKASRGRAWLALCGATLSSVWKLLKGEYLIRRYGLV